MNEPTPSDVIVSVGGVVRNVTVNGELFVAEGDVTIDGCIVGGYAVTGVVPPVERPTA